MNYSGGQSKLIASLPSIFDGRQKLNEEQRQMCMQLLRDSAPVAIGGDVGDNGIAIMFFHDLQLTLEMVRSKEAAKAIAENFLHAMQARQDLSAKVENLEAENSELRAHVDKSEAALLELAAST